MMKTTIIPALFAFLLLNTAVLIVSTNAIADEQKPGAASDQSITEAGNQGCGDINADDAQETAVQDEQKTRLNNLFKAVKEKSKAIKPAKYEVTLPVSTAGARGAETRQADRFAVIWPDGDISPITALVENIESGVEQGEDKTSLEAQLEEFKKVFPEYSDHELLLELADIIKSIKM